jgi:hypothetical protein
MRAARRSTARLLVLAVTGALVVVLAIAAIPGLDGLNPFKTETKDRTQPVILKSLERLSEYRAATANLQVVVDIEEDAGLLPSFIKGSKTLLVANGTVDAGVNFRGLKGDSVRVNEDRTAVTITLPGAALSDARIDLERTRVFDTDRGLVDRIGEALGDGGADDERKLLRLAQRKLADAARADPNITASAERNTRQMLTELLRGLGFKRIDIRFDRTGAT